MVGARWALIPPTVAAIGSAGMWIGLQRAEFLYTASPMATQTDTSQLKKLGFVLLGLGALMVVAGLVMGISWQLYGGIGAAVIGLGIALFAMKKG